MDNLLSQALRTDNVDAAIAPIMQALGITSGDVAAGIFGDAWQFEDERRNLLAQWLHAEIAYA